MSRAKISTDPKLLKRLYRAEGLSTYAIARRLQCSPGTIENRLEEFHIPKKSRSLARMKYPKKNFDGNTTDRAYLVGFRIGDLNVYKTVPTAETIVVRCHTTQKDQVEILERVFGAFGKVSVSDNNAGHYHVNCFLNSSFSFLLPKDSSSFSWIQKPKEFAAFTAGYVDAEGNFIINQGRARFKIDSYDKEVLDFIGGWLTREKMKFKFRRISKLGDTQYIKGIPATYPQDLWRLNINEAKSLLRFIRGIKPFIRHQSRANGIKQCEDNILNRMRYGTIT